MNLSLEERKQYFKDNITIEVGKSKRPLGGQQCGLERLPVILKSEDLEIEISVNHFRQNYKNHEYVKMLFDLIIDDLVK